MQQGYLTTDNFSDVLRDISQRRRTGLLVLHTGQESQQVQFWQGKVIDVDLGQEPGPQKLYLKLKKAGFISDGSLEFSAYHKLFEYLSSQAESAHLFDEEFFQQSVRHFLFDELLALQLDHGTRYEFVNRGLDEGIDTRSHLSVSQFLLDKSLVEQELPALEREYRSDFMITPAGQQPADLDDECGLVYSILGDGLSVERLLGCCTLSRFHTMFAMKRLQVLGHIILENPAVASTDSQSAPDLFDEVQDIFDVVEQSLDKSFGVPDITVEVAEPQALKDDIQIGMSVSPERITNGVQDRGLSSSGSNQLKESSLLGKLNARVLRAESIPHLYQLGLVVLTGFAVIYRWNDIFELFFQI